MMILEAKKIRKSYGNKHNKHEVLKGIDLQIQKGEFVSIMGPSGSGKTTLLNVLSSIDQVSGGTININQAEMTNMKEKQLAEFRKQHLGFIFQEYNLLDTLTVKENILLPLSITKISKKEAGQKFEEVAKELGIFELKDKYPNEISGGQKQRTSAARAFIHEPSIIFADVAASFCSRVVFIKDGQIYTQLNKGGQDRQMFFQDIMKTQGVLGGVQHEH